MLGKSLRRQLTSPAMLLVAGGIGFAAENFPRQPASTADHTQRSRAARNKLVEKALKLIALARILVKTFPSVGLDPSAQSGLPGQTPAPPYRSAAP